MFRDIIYQRGSEIELQKSGLRFSRELRPVYYKGRRIEERRVDFFVEEKIRVELKAIIKLENIHLAQAKNYLEAYSTEVGWLINFGAVSIEFKRLENKKHKTSTFPVNP